MSLRTTYSDLGQDRWIIDDVFASLIAEGYKGFFIEAGAATGTDASNTFLLEKQHGWTGVLVEPNVYFFDILQKNRQSKCFNVVLSDSDGELDFIQAGYRGVAPDHVRAVFDKRGLDMRSHPPYQQDADGTPATETALPALTLRTLLDRIEAPETIDYFSLDVEGGELAVLKGFPFERRRIRALTIETLFPSGARTVEHDHRAACHELLTEHGYSLVKTLSYDDCYMHRDFM
ncbi:MAG: FkbM family methyltransferase [Rhizobiales bacterium]|nr:FkbM family methyltransferase [Hyphomicrobiales bacterium]